MCYVIADVAQLTLPRINPTVAHVIAFACKLTRELLGHKRFGTKHREEQSKFFVIA
jgi:hypothetical protein